MVLKSTPKTSNLSFLKKLESSSHQNPLLALAPMAGFTNLPFRLLCKKYGADLVFSEMVSAAALSRKNNAKKTLSLVRSVPEEAPLFIQLFGKDPDDFSKAAVLVSSLPASLDSKIAFAFLRKPEGIDINFGCPAKKVIKQGAGCALMSSPKRSREIIKAVTNSTNLPVSIKIRAGIGKISALKFLDKIADLDWKILTIHARTFEQGFSGESDWKLVRKIKDIYKNKIVLTNGGIFSVAKAKEVLKNTKSDGIALARGALENPLLFSEIKDNSFSEKKVSPLILKKKIAKEHLQLVQKMNLALFPNIKKQILWYFKGVPGGKEIRKKIAFSNSLKELDELLSKIG